MLNLVRALWQSQSRDQQLSFRFDKPLVLLQSDDWGRVGVRDEEGRNQLETRGIELGGHPYDLYALETAADVAAVRDLLKRHRDSTGRCACLVMNFVVANLDFPRMAAEDFESIYLLPLRDGWPGRWRRPGLSAAYRDGVEEGVFYPALHGLTHFCALAAKNALRGNSERRALLRKLWATETPYIYWRMPWIGYEYNNPEWPERGFLSAESQTELIVEAANEFEAFFGHRAESACAPGYRANRDTHQAWASVGVKVAQNGSGVQRAPHLDEFGLLHLHRSFDFEPSQVDLGLEKYVHHASECVERGSPIVISTHSLNFHSSLRDFRSGTLQALDDLLFALEAKFPDLLYVHDGNMHEIVTGGGFRHLDGITRVRAIPMDARSVARGGA